MLNVLTNEPVTLVFDIVEDGQFVSPDVGSVHYSVRLETGEVLNDHHMVLVTTTPGQTTILLPLPGAVNQKAKTTEIRFVRLHYTVGGRPGSSQIAYRIHDWINVTASSNDVRAYLGVNGSELPDQDVDMIAAYLYAKREVPILDELLTEGGVRTLQANRLVTLYAVTDVAHTMQTRAIQSQGSETARVSRFSNIDWKLFQTKASSEISELIGEFTSRFDSAFPLFRVSAGQDPITGG